MYEATPPAEAAFQVIVYCNGAIHQLFCKTKDRADALFTKADRLRYKNGWEELADDFFTRVSIPTGALQGVKLMPARDEEKALRMRHLKHVVREFDAKHSGDSWWKNTGEGDGSEG